MSQTPMKVNAAMEALFGPRTVDQLPATETAFQDEGCPMVFVLGEKGDLNMHAREALTTVVNGKPVLPKSGTRFIADGETFTALADEARFYIPTHDAYVRYFQDTVVSGEEKGKVVNLRVPVVGERDPKNAQGQRKDASGMPLTTGLIERVAAVVLIDCPKSGVHAAKITVSKGRTRVVKALYSATLPFLDSSKFKGAADMLGLTAAEASKRVKDGMFPSLRAGMETEAHMKASKSAGGSDYAVWEADRSTLEAPSAERLDALKACCNSEAFMRCYESVEATKQFVAEGLEAFDEGTK